MSSVEIRLSSFILKDHFGENVEKIVVYLLHKGRKSLRSICSDTDLDKNLVKKCLSVCIQHQLIKFEESQKTPTLYQAIPENILLRARYPKFVYSAKILFGDIAELIIENVLMNGAEVLSSIVLKVAERLESDVEQSNVKHDKKIVYQKCEELIKNHFLKRLNFPCDSEASADGGEQSKDNHEGQEYTIPPGVLQGIGKGKPSDVSDEPPSKKSKSENGQSGNSVSKKAADEGIYWHVNFETFHQHLFDELIQSAASEKFNQSAAKIVGTILKESKMERNIRAEATKSIALYELVRKLPSLPVITQQEVSQYLTLLTDKKSGGFLVKTDDSGGGMFCIDFKRCADMLCQHSIESVVRERLGSKACRIFRLLIMKKNLEQKQIEELAMIPSKETKELLYKMFQERLISLQEVSKSGDYAPSRTFYLFSVDLPLVARLLLNRSCQAMANMMSKREQLMTENKRLLEKNERIEGILSALSSNEENQGAVVQELEELITPSEKEQLNKLKLHLAKLESGEIQIDETLQLLKQYLLFH